LRWITFGHLEADECGARLAELAPTTLALIHGPSYAGDGATQLRGLADAYDERLHIEGQQLRPPVQRPEAAKIT
jgi:hypothetical protein